MSNYFNKFKPFLIGFTGVFLMVALSHIGLQQMGMVSPINGHVDHFVSLLPKLDNIPNNYFLTKESSIIKQADASEVDSDESSYAVLDYDTGKVILDKNLANKLPIASLTKILSAVVALDLAKPTDEITVSEKATEMIPSKVFLKEGERLSVEELLNCALLASANDCAQALADGIDQKYGDQVFIQAMNEKAKFIGLKNSHFVNPMGFDDPNHYSSAEDLAILSHYALENYPLISQIVNKPTEDLLATNTHQEFYLNNWNGLLGVYPGVRGIKIGNTDDAKNTTIVISQRVGEDGVKHNILTVLLGADGILKRDMIASQLLDLGFEQEWGLKPVNITEQELRVKYASWKQ